MKLPATPLPLDLAQTRLVLELLELRTLAPQDTAARLRKLTRSGAFTAGQKNAIELLLELDDDHVAGALLRFVDDEARELVRAQLALEARLSFVAA